MYKRYFNLILSVAFLSLCGNVKPVSAATSDPNDPASFPRLRGFDVRFNVNEALMADAKNLGVNSIRLILQPNLAGSDDTVKAWDGMLKNLPSQLDAARRLHLFVVVSLFSPPVPNYRVLAKDRDFLHKFWTDPNTLDAMIAQAVEVAKVLKPYEGMVWLELKNEPLDWSVYPKIPQNWPQWSQKIIDSVRAVSDVPIVVQVGPGGFSSGFADFPALRGKNIIYSVHDYLPHNYTHQGVTSLVGTDLKNPYGNVGLKWPVPASGTEGEWNRDRLRKEFAPVIAFSKRNNARIYVGEFGVARWAPNADAYLRDNIELFEELGWDWAYHAFRESHIWSFEDDETYSDSKHARRASAETARARVIREALAKNQNGGSEKPQE